jgi:hypothetical protein
MSIPVTVSEFDRTRIWHFRAKWLPAEYMDGDTFTALCDVGYRGRHEPRIRLVGYSTPERYEPGGLEATVALIHALQQGVGKWPLRIVSLQRETVVSEVTTFERYVSVVYVVRPGDQLVNIITLLNVAEVS